MLKHGLVTFCCVTAASFLVVPASGQPSNRDRAKFRIPSVGEPLPAVKLLDETGREFSTHDLKENHTVLIFGCLT